jgi:hypothetical protein
MRLAKPLIAFAIGSAILFEMGSIGYSEELSILKLFRPSTPAEQITDDTFRLKPEHGPWLILASSLEGTDSQEKANALAKELRSKYRLNAYVLHKPFDYSQSVPGAGIDVEGRQKKFRYADDRKVDGYGVLVGDFANVDDPKVKETIALIKKLQPQALTGKENAEPEHSVAAYKRLLRSKNEDASKPNGPMAGAFVTRNPLLPADFFQAPTVDKFVQNLNKNADHSLLKATGRFTVRVATFRGADSVVLQGSRAAQESSKNGAGDGLEQAAFRANLAAKTLRLGGMEAYEFHDRNISIVTVGSFDSLGSEDAKGTFVYSPEIQQTIREFGGAKEYKTTKYGPTPIPKNLLDIVNYRKIPDLLVGTEAEKLRKVVNQYAIPFDLDPKPMAVPHAETSNLYKNALLGKN